MFSLRDGQSAVSQTVQPALDQPLPCPHGPSSPGGLVPSFQPPPSSIHFISLTDRSLSVYLFHLGIFAPISRVTKWIQRDVHLKSDESYGMSEIRYIISKPVCKITLKHSSWRILTSRMTPFFIFHDCSFS